MLSAILVYFTHAAVVVFGLITVLWLISLIAKDASIIDIFWGFGFALVGATCLYLAGDPSPFQWLLGLLPILWGLRLTLYLAKRNLGHGEDKRYIAMQKRAAKKGMSEMAWRVRALFTIFWGQGLLIMLVSAPVWVGMATSEAAINAVGAATPGIKGGPAQQAGVALGLLPILGAIIWLIGTLFEAIGDCQLARFLKANKDYDGQYEDKPVMDQGLWRYTRHPNYFGNATLWWGIFITALSAPWAWATVFGPLIMNFLLVRVSGRDLLERKLKTRPAYRDYVERTSSFFPRPPR